MVVPVYKDGKEIELKFSSPGFQNSSYRIKKVEELNEKLIALDKEGITHRFISRFKTGFQPKSVRFIDNTRLAIPLLEDEGMDVLDINTGETVRLSPPEKYKKKLGFVETISIPEHNELWVSQMQANAVHVFDLKTLAYKATVDLTGKWSKILLYDPTRDLVYCSNWISEDISVIDRKTKTETRKTDKIGLPRGLLLSKDGKELYIAQFSASNQESGGGRLGIYSMDKEKLIDTIGPPGNKRHIVSGNTESKIYVSDMCCSKIEVYDLKEKKFKSRFLYSINRIRLLFLLTENIFMFLVEALIIQLKVISKKVWCLEECMSLIRLQTGLRNFGKLVINLRALTFHPTIVT